MLYGKLFNNLLPTSVRGKRSRRFCLHASCLVGTGACPWRMHPDENSVRHSNFQSVCICMRQTAGTVGNLHDPPCSIWLLIDLGSGYAARNVRTLCDALRCDTVIPSAPLKTVSLVAYQSGFCNHAQLLQPNKFVWFSLQK